MEACLKGALRTLGTQCRAKQVHRKLYISLLSFTESPWLLVSLTIWVTVSSGI